MKRIAVVLTIILGSLVLSLPAQAAPTAPGWWTRYVLPVHLRWQACSVPTAYGYHMPAKCQWA